MPGRRIQFRFMEPKGFRGVHRFEIEPVGDACTRLRHVIGIRRSGVTWLARALAFGRCTMATLEDALGRADSFVGKQLPRRELSTWVRLVRWIVRGAGETRDSMNARGGHH